MKKMDPYTFQKYLDNNDIESILANGGDDLTESQLKQVKSLGKQLGQMKLDAQRMKLATQPGYAESVLLPLQRKILEQSGNMNYAQAAKIRKKDFPDLMTDKLISGQDTFSSTRSALSDRSKARSMGLKEKFDPLNIAKVLTGGSNLAPAMLGRLLGRNKSDIKYFSGKKEYAPRRESSYYNNYTTPSMSGGSRKATTVLNKMLSFMEKSRTDDMQEQDTLDSFNEMNEKMREDRHKEVVDVFIEATKAKRKAEKDLVGESVLVSSNLTTSKRSRLQTDPNSAEILASHESKEETQVLGSLMGLRYRDAHASFLRWGIIAVVFLITLVGGGPLVWYQIPQGWRELIWQKITFTQPDSRSTPTSEPSTNPDSPPTAKPPASAATTPTPTESPPAIENPAVIEPAPVNELSTKASP